MKIEKNSIEEWKNIDRDAESISKITSLVANGQISFISLDPLSRLTFGTAGLRGVLRPGYDGMNAVVIMQTAQGLLRFCEKYCLDQIKGGICIAHDARHESEKFSRITAGVFVAAGIKTYYFDELSPTPYCAFFTEYLRCCIGVMVTASHNPSEYNGYKVYGVGCGVEIVEPVDRQIEDEIINSLAIAESTYNYEDYLTEEYENRGTLVLLNERSEITQEYYRAIQKVCFHEELNAKLDLNVKYSAMWGVGYTPFVRAILAFNFQQDKITFFAESCQPDPDFGGVKRPNPEEHPNMLMLADQCDDNTDIVVVNDPDADRVALMEFSSDGEPYIFHGNEIGIVLCMYMIEMTKDVKNRCLACSTVSTELLRNIAKQNNCEFTDTLTGLKWIGRANKKWLREGKNMIFGFEEAIGYTCGCENGLIQGDKDGVEVGCVVIEMANWLKQKRGLTILEYLHSIYEQYGYVCWANSGFSVNSMDDIKQLFELLIEQDGSKFSAHDRQYVDKIGPFQVLRVRDMKLPGYDSEDGKPVLPCSEQEMITLYCKDIICTIRPSGTEPKVKYYIESESASAMEQAEQGLSQFEADFLRLLGKK